MLRFGRVTVDVARREVELDGEPRHLEPQAFDLLVHLIDQRHRVVPKTELLDVVWGDQFVSESALTTRIKEVRRAVGDDGTRQAVVRNHRGRGYRFVAEPVETVPDGADPERPGTGPAGGGRIPMAAPVPSLHGREDDTAGVADLLETAALVTLVGPGGVGKTSLARDVAQRIRDRHGDGIHTIHLATVDDPADAVHVLRRHTRLDDAGPAEADLLSAVAELDALIVLDNCEHLVGEAARLIDAILARGGPVRILATSRERLGVAGEWAWPVEPLDRESARRLLLDRVAAVDPTWSADDPDALDRLVDLVDRLPLAVEMAAARLPTVGLADMIELLDQRLDLLDSPVRQGEERHRTLPALIEWSEQLLEPAAKTLLADLSVFAGPVAATDIAPVVGLDRAELVAGPLTDLVERSLVVADTSGRTARYRLLETVRACVAPRRDPAVDARHAHHIDQALGQADRLLRGPEEPAGARRVDGLRSEIRAAHHWAAANDPTLAASLTASLLHYAHERQWAEPAGWVEPLVEGDGPGRSGAAAAFVAAVASNRGDYRRAAALAGRCLDDADPRVVASAADTLANVGIYEGDLATARHHSRTLLDLAERTGDAVTWTLGVVAGTLACLYGGDAPEARACLDAARAPGPLSPSASAWLAYAEGEVAAACGQPDRAIDWFDRAIELGDPAGNLFATGVARISSLATRARSGDVTEALEAFLPVLVQYRRARSQTHVVTALRNLIGLLVRAGHDRPAAELLGALSTPEVKAVYGVESDLLDQARSTIDDRNGPSAAAWSATGRGRDPLWALDHAIDTLDRLGEPAPEGP